MVKNRIEQNRTDSAYPYTVCMYIEEVFFSKMVAPSVSAHCQRNTHAAYKTTPYSILFYSRFERDALMIPRRARSQVVCCLQML